MPRDTQPYLSSMKTIGTALLVCGRRALYNVPTCSADTPQDPWHGRTFDMLPRFESGLDGPEPWIAGGDTRCDA